jgi:hypothetical protein
MKIMNSAGIATKLAPPIIHAMREIRSLGSAVFQIHIANSSKLPDAATPK